MEPVAPVGLRFGEAGGELSYGGYLAVAELLELQRTLTDEHDELLFIVVHQVYELWFRLLLHELAGARDALQADDLPRARHDLGRVAAIERVLIQQVDVIDTMRPTDFLRFRERLAPASGFQSVQFRELEVLSGLRDGTTRDVLARLRPSEAEAARLRRRLDEPSLWDAFTALLARRGVVLDDLAAHADLFEVAEALLDHDEALVRWRHRHVLMAERQLGAKSGTGGSSGAAYLRTTLERRCYPALWELRTRLS